MDARFYNSEDIDVERLANDVASAYQAQGYQAQQVGNRDQMLVQLKKGGDFEAILGMQAAVSLTIQRTTGGVLALIGQQRWLDKAAIGAVGLVAFPILWPLTLTAGAGALRQASLGNQVLNVVDGLARQQRPGIQVGPVPLQLMPHVQQQWGQPTPQQQQTPYYIPSGTVVDGSSRPTLPTPMSPVATGLNCSFCNTPYGPGDTFCSGCGRPLTAPKTYCPNCNSELKANLAFCPKCGASTYQPGSSASIPQASPAPQATSYASSAPAPQAPAYRPPTPSVPTYTPPTPASQTPVYQPPTYTPPAAPTPPPVPTYIPPTPQSPTVMPQPQIFYVPSNQQPTVEDQPKTQKAPEQYYVPPVTQEPVVPSQPKVTMVPATPNHEPPPPSKPHPQKQYYVPSHPEAEQTLQDVATQPTVQHQVEPSEATLAAQPTIVDAPASGEQATTIAASQPVEPVAPWGTLTFSDGQSVQLTGERDVVGRYDHDLGGIEPEVDLSKTEGSDTVSRIHATFERNGSTYTLTDLNSTNATRINNKRLTPDTPTTIKDGDTLQFGKITCTFKTK
jgi:FHA domain/Double zinc ribbon